MEQSSASLSNDKRIRKDVSYSKNGDISVSAMDANARQGVVYAGFWERYAAVFIDGMAIFIAMTGLGFLFGSVIPEMSGNRLLRGGMNILVSWLYAIFMLQSRQATLGKQVMGIVVVCDKSDHLTLGKIVLRETLGKFLSAILLGVGYVMVAFTDKKQALHDKIAGTVVVRKDSLAKPKKWIVALAIISAIIVPVIVIGFLGTAAFSGFQSAKGMAYDTTVKSTLLSVIPEMVLYQDKNKNSLYGFQSVNLIALSREESNKCFSEPIQNIALNGKSLAIFAKLCDDSGKYFCVDSDGQSGNVKEAYALSGESSCVENANTSSTSIEEKIARDAESKNVPSSEIFSGAAPSFLPGEDANVFNLAQRMKQFLASKNGYNDFPKNIASEYGENMELDISPDGKSFVAHQILKNNPTWSSCIENSMTDAVVVATEAVRKTFHCR